MRYLILSVCLLIGNILKAQIKVPNGFIFVKGESPVGRDDYYRNTNYTLAQDLPFMGDGGPPESIEEEKSLFADIYGIAFKITKDRIIYGTGYSYERFKYIIVVDATAYILSSAKNDSGFSTYSTWLMKAIRDAIKSGKELYFK